MSTLQQSNSGKVACRWAPAQHGWIGVDIGFRETKVAQIVRRGRDQRLFAKWSFPIPGADRARSWEDYEQTISLIAKEFATLQPMFRGRRVALSLPFDQAPLRLVDVPRSDDTEMRCMIREELAAEFRDQEICFDYWDTAGAGRCEDAVAQLAVVIVPARRSQWVAQRFAAHGFDCRNLDAGLCGLARATALAPTDQETGCSPRRPTAGSELAIDIGWTSTRLLFVRQGEPQFCRVIPEAGCQAFVQNLQDRFAISASEATLLLEKIGVGVPGKGSLIGPATEIHSCLAPVLLHLLAEIRRTLQFVQRQMSSQDPRSMWLFGGGTHIRCLGDHIADQFGLPVRSWELPSHQQTGRGPSNAAFAGAIALSLLAWEPDPCR